MKRIIDSKRGQVDKLIAAREDSVSISLSSIILDSFPSRLWNELSPEEVCDALKKCLTFILTPPSYSEKNGKKEFDPKVCVFNPVEDDRSRLSFSLDTTVVGVHVMNRPFVYESLRNYFIKRGCRLIGAAHPIFFPHRKGGEVESVSTCGDGDGELFINLYIEKVPDEEIIEDIRDDLLAILRCISFSVEDFETMKERVRTRAREVENMTVPDSKYVGAEISEFLDWLATDNFVLLGVRDYILASPDGEPGLTPVKGGDLGIFREKGLVDRIIPGFISEVEDIVLTRSGQARFISSDFCSTGGNVLYQLSPMEFFSIRHERDDSGGRKETVLIGRLTRGAMHWRSDAIPMLRYKSESVTAVFSKAADYFRYREARAVFNFIPKQELFYANVDQLKSSIFDIMSAESDEDVTIHIRMGDGGRYAMVMVTIASNDNSYSVRKAIETYLSSIFHRDIAVWHHSGTEARTLLFYYFCSPGKEFDTPDLPAAMEEIKKIAAGWDNQFQKALYSAYEGRAPSIYERYIDSIGKVYKGSNSPEGAAIDVGKLETVFDEGRLQIGFSHFASDMAELSFYSLSPLPLMQILKELENFGLYVTEERAYKLNDIDKKGDAYIYNYTLEDSSEKLETLEKLLPIFIDAMLAVKEGRLEDDSLNRLLILEGLDRRNIELVRTFKNYMIQINRTYNNRSVIETIVRHSRVMGTICEYFSAKFSPFSAKRKRESLMKELEAKIIDYLADIQSLADFQVISTLFNIGKFTTRTNFYIEPEKGCISIKLASDQIPEVPSPRPMAEIYVHAPSFEGVHLRGGAVSRGGIRWSERPDDFRTEILGLMKTQMLKNSIIVPEGAKGGFIIKKGCFDTREQQYEYMKLQYTAFISGLLDITDNYAAGKELHPENVLTYDGFDPYLVVAADKGTALLSDRANEISKSYAFWLDDAFASGGRSGYDHKKIGITARGAWESVKRHFRELDIDIQKESVTVVGIGDMSGDVFGNGMLLSDKIKLVGAFNHMHLFLDPDPEPETSFKERERLFKMPGSSWTDYRSDLISKGGGLFLRSAKSIPVSAEMSAWLATDKKEVTGEEMVRLLLKSKVDLLYNGGIGTYVKSKVESTLDVGDNANDRVRVNGFEVKAKVIGEGGNLGLTQRGRLEYSAAGGKCYTDALDNSGGVNISDHEVNLKIMLNYLVEIGEIGGVAERDAMLEEMTDEVASKVLKNNYLQSAACSMDYLRARSAPDSFVTVVDEMERTLSFDRSGEFVPPAQDMKEAIRKGEELFTRPLIAVLIGYQKMKYFNELLDSSMVNTVFAQTYLRDYFPETISKDFAPHLLEHRLKAEIISTMIINRIINRAGVTLFPLTASYTGRSIPGIAKGYIIIENLIQADSFREDIYSLDNRISSRLQYRYLMELEEVISYALKWFIINQSEERISFDFIGQYRQLVSSLQDDLWDCVRKICRKEKLDKLDSTLEKDLSLGMPEDLAKRYLLLPFMKDIMDIIRIKEAHHSSFIETAMLYLKVSDYFSLDWLAEGLDSIKAADKWGVENISHLRHEIKECQDAIVVSVLDFKRKSENLQDTFEKYLQDNSERVARYSKGVEELKAEGKLGIISVNVIVRKLSDLISKGCEGSL
ncbi:MAG: NAD-glutamate dehydrogenase [bacterium]|nr:NAD-glutamate dehydrogenase [bacterium]